MRFKDKVVIVTGAAQGIGRGIALGLAQEGAKVVLADRSPIVHQVTQEINAAGGNASDILVDLETYGGAEEMVQDTLQHYGRVNILINNVGGAIQMKPFEAFDANEIINEVNRSLFPTLWGCRAVLPCMIAQECGVIVNISSIATRGIHRAPYSASKGGVNTLTQSLALEYADRGIRINAVATGGTEAPARLIPRYQSSLTEQEEIWMQEVVDQTIASSHLKRYSTIDEQVKVILFLASEDASYMTGSIVPVGGGDQG